MRFSTKIQTENVFFGKKNEFERASEAKLSKFSSETILPPNAPCSELGPEKWYGATFVKKIPTKNVDFRMDETSLRDTFAPNRAI